MTHDDSVGTYICMHILYYTRERKEEASIFFYLYLFILLCMMISSSMHLPAANELIYSSLWLNKTPSHIYAAHLLGHPSLDEHLSWLLDH